MKIADAYKTVKFIWSHPLNNDHKIKALINFIKWQLGTLIINTPVIVPWINDCTFIAEKGDRGLTGNIYGGLMEPEEMLFLLHTLQKNWCFLDVGANIGAYTLLASKVIGADSIAFEPIPKTVLKLHKQIELNCIENKVKVVATGVADKPGIMHFTNLNSTTNHASITGQTENTLEIETITLDDVIEEKNGDLFIKIDVEGLEYLVLKGALNLLKSGRVQAIILEICGSGSDFGFSDINTHQFLTQFGYKPIRYDFFSKKIHELGSFRFDTPNTIYIKDITKFTALAKTSKTYVLHVPQRINI